MVESDIIIDLLMYFLICKYINYSTTSHNSILYLVFDTIT
jgi:hypothetical protein